VVHASPGRVRLRVDRSSTDLTALTTVAQRLTAQNGTYDLGLNEATRSLLIRYDPAIRDLPSVLEAISASGVQILTADTSTSSESAQQPNTLAEAVETTTGRLNEWVGHRTNGAADLRTLVPAGFALLALREVLSGRAGAAPWYALAWYAFDSFWKLHRSSSDRNDSDRIEEK
jgi:hypothetical protein